MILVRDVFQVKFGKARDVKAAWKEAESIMSQLDTPRPRMLTDLTGPSYTFVLESEFDNLASYEANMQKVFASDDWRQWYQKLTPLVESGRREIFTIVE